jgi:hypothetical protein
MISSLPIINLFLKHKFLMPLTRPLHNTTENILADKILEMDEETRNRLAAKKHSLQAQQEVIAQSRLLADWWFPTLELVQNAGVEWRLEYFAAHGVEQSAHWTTLLKQMPWSKFPPEKFPLIEPPLYVHEGVMAAFPGTHPLRYQPNLASRAGTANADDQEMLNDAAQQLGITDEYVYFFFMRLSPVIQLRFTDLVALAVKGLFEVPEDICIAPSDLSWLIFRSLEGEWQYGPK